MNIQCRQTKCIYWRTSNVRSAGSASTALGILNPTFIVWNRDPMGALTRICELRDRHRWSEVVEGGRCASWPAHVQETLLALFQHQAGEAPSGISGRVYSDPIGAYLWDKRRRVAVHDKLSVL